MSMQNGVMRMRPVAGGLEIKPGQTVTLKPGGYHMMFMQLQRPAKGRADRSRAPSNSRRPGSVTVVYQVCRMGAPGPAMAAWRHAIMHMDMHAS